MKSEPDVYSIDDLARDRRTCWSGVRNYVARNFMRDEMQVGDLVLFYHSNADPKGVAGLAKVCRTAYPDATQFDRKSEYFDPKATRATPRWFMVDVEFVERFPEVVELATIKGTKELRGMMVTQRGARLSVQPVAKEHFDIVRKLGGGKRR
jgi:predicted RNA-binding protein with PUA-like domain